MGCDVVHRTVCGVANGPTFTIDKKSFAFLSFSLNVAGAKEEKKLARNMSGTRPGSSITAHELLELYDMEFRLSNTEQVLEAYREVVLEHIASGAAVEKSELPSLVQGDLENPRRLPKRNVGAASHSAPRDIIETRGKRCMERGEKPTKKKEE